MSKREKIYFRVDRGCLVPADSYAQSKLRERGYHLGDLLSAELTKPRNPKFNRLVHRIDPSEASGTDPVPAAPAPAV